MARGKTLLSLLQDFHAEIRASSNAAHNTATRENHVRLLQRVQEWLYDENDWPHLRVSRRLNLQAGQRYYSPPEEIDVDRIETVQVRYGGEWVDMDPGIGAAHFRTYDSDADERSWPVCRWAPHEDSEIEIWPVPSETANETTLEAMLRVTGLRKLNPLVADDDRSDIDGMLIVLYAAAEELASRGAADAELKLRAAQQRKTHLLGQRSKVQTFRLFGGSDPARERRGPPRVHYRKE